MESKVNKTIEVVLKLSQEELNTIVAAYGSATPVGRREVSSSIGLKMVSNDEADALYRKLKEIATNI